MPKCPNCGAALIQMVFSQVCSAECDLKAPEPEPLVPISPMFGTWEVKLTRYLQLGRCYRFGKYLFIHPLDWGKGTEHVGSLHYTDLGDGPKPLDPWVQV